MLLSRLAVAVLGGVLLLGGTWSVADGDRGRDMRHKLMQRDDRGHYAPHTRGWQYPRTNREYRNPQGYHEHRNRPSMPRLGQYQYEPRQRPSSDRLYQQDRLGNERGGSFNSERFYPDSPSLETNPRVYPPSQPVMPDFPRRNPHPPGIYRPLHDNGLQLPSPR